MIQCLCKAQGKKYSSKACGCHNQHLACKTFCYYYGRQDCLTQQFTAVEQIETDDVDSNLPEDFDDYFKQDNEDGESVPDDKVSDYLDEWE